MTKSTHHSFDIELAAKYGIIGAILIHHIQHWVNHNKRLGKTRKNGRTWTYQTHVEIAAWFPYLSASQVKRELYKLKVANVILIENYNKSCIDRTNWYAFVDEKMFTIDDSVSSTDDSVPWTDDSVSSIPDTKTESKPDTEKDNVGTMPSYKKKRSSSPDRFIKKLTSEQKKLHDQIVGLAPCWGDPVKSDDVCAWFTKEDPFTCDQVRMAIKVYQQDCNDAKKRGEQIRSAGAAIRNALNTGRTVRNDDSEFNEAHACRNAPLHAFITTSKRYATIMVGSSVETVEYNLPRKEFLRQFDKWVQAAKIYREM
jgi:hypothetical protein